MADGVERREQIVETGARLFAEKGYERTSLQEVADVLGVTRPALYYYYQSKEELLFEITSFVMDQLAEDLREISAGHKTPLEKVRELVRRYVKFFAAHPSDLTVMSTQLDSLGPEHREAAHARQREYLHVVKGIVRELLAGHPGNGLDETSVTFALLGGMNWIFKWYDPAGRIDPDQLAADFMQFFSYGFRGPAQEG